MLVKWKGDSTDCFAWSDVFAASWTISDRCSGQQTIFLAQTAVPAHVLCRIRQAPVQFVVFMRVGVQL